ncbi:MAG: hypothetical protein Fur0046_23080 [Cyanobacteria bacterium J069]|nr:MAG: DUF3082 domain-containing protein [Cyanobacteria bacterium J069]
MSDINPAQESVVKKPLSFVADETPPTPVRCWTGAAISGAIATALYYLTLSIHSTFASKPLPTGNSLAVSIGSAVRTLVLGMSCLALVTFGIATVGLVALGIQLLFQPKKSDA